MATTHTPLPSGDGHAGERAFAVQLGAIAGTGAHLWFGIDYLAGVNDVDAILGIPGVGFFVVEVKAVSLDAIEEYGPGFCRIRNRRDTKTPLQQARKAQIQLVEYLRDVAGIKRPPFFFVSAAFPRIARSEFLAKWQGTAVAAQAAGMLFADDLASENSLRTVLERILVRPPLGGAPARRPTVTERDVQVVRAAIASEAAIAPTANDIERMKGVDERTRSRRRKYLVPGDRKEVLFQGKPGTGKTFRLLEIAIAHSRAGRHVLMATYNMVLAAELRRMMLVERERADSVNSMGAVDVVDVFQLLNRYDWHEDDFGGADHSHNASRKVRRLQDMSQPLDVYGTVLVDEAQDLEDWAYELLKWHASADAEWFASDGNGQALYRDTKAPWLQAYAARSRQAKTTQRFDRVLRTAKADFWVAQCTFECSPDMSALDTWMAKHPLTAPAPADDPADVAQLALDIESLSFVDEQFDRLGSPPVLSNLPFVPESLSDSAYRQAQVEAYERLIGEELAILNDLGTPGDLAILVPHTHKKHGMGSRVVEAMKMLGVPFVDQVAEDARRSLRSEGAVRLVTYHSARGVEASRILLLGLEDLGRVTGGPENRQRNLAYVALSRAKHGTRIVVPSSRTGPHLDFVRSLVGRVKAELDAAPTPCPTPTNRRSDDRKPEWIKGQVVRVVAKRGFGFIEHEKGETFFHFNALFGLDEDEVSPGTPVVFSVVAVADGQRASIVADQEPAQLQAAAANGLVPAIVSEPIGDRGFGFALSPFVNGRILLHSRTLEGIRKDHIESGQRLDIEIQVDSDGRARALRATLEGS